MSTRATHGAPPRALHVQLGYSHKVLRGDGAFAGLIQPLEAFEQPIDAVRRDCRLQCEQQLISRHPRVHPVSAVRLSKSASCKAELLLAPMDFKMTENADGGK